MHIVALLGTVLKDQISIVLPCPERSGPIPPRGIISMVLCLEICLDRQYLMYSGCNGHIYSDHSDIMVKFPGRNSVLL